MGSYLQTAENTEIKTDELALGNLAHADVGGVSEGVGMLVCSEEGVVKGLETQKVKKCLKHILDLKNVGKICYGKRVENNALSPEDRVRLGRSVLI